MQNSLNKNSSIAILGIGLEGQALVEHFQKHGYTNMTLCDEKQNLDKYKEEFNVKTGDDAFKNLDQDYIFRSPGIHKDHPEIKKARKNGSKISSATKLFFDLCPCPIIGITGTKGKGTTSTLIYEILKEAGKDAYLGGNIGVPPFDFIDEINENSIVVLELSSFQLHDIEKSPHIAVVLNTTSEHLDYHKNVDEYVDAKSGIVKYQNENDILIVNIDYPYHKKYESLTPAKKLYVSRKTQVEDGVYLKNDEIISKQTDKNIICSTKEVGLMGGHNFENILPAVTVATYLEIPVNVIAKVVKAFKGLPHRLEFIKNVDDVDYYNDSFSTTPETCIAAIKAFSCPLVLIAGGSEKHSDYTELGKAIAHQSNLETVVLMGDTAERIEKAIPQSDESRNTKLNIIHVETYKEAFSAAHANAKKDGAVLLSPASASFGLFKNYKHRGETFRKWVESL